jgi:hypothetical protein
MEHGWKGDLPWNPFRSFPMFKHIAKDQPNDNYTQGINEFFHNVPLSKTAFLPRGERLLVLKLIQLAIKSILSKQSLVSADFANAALVQDDDLIGVLYRR